MNGESEIDKRVPNMRSLAILTRLTRQGLVRIGMGATLAGVLPTGVTAVMLTALGADEWLNSVGWGLLPIIGLILAMSTLCVSDRGLLWDERTRSKERRKTLLSRAPRAIPRSLDGVLADRLLSVDELAMLMEKIERQEELREEIESRETILAGKAAYRPTERQRAALLETITLAREEVRGLENEIDSYVKHLRWRANSEKEQLGEA